MKSLKCKIEMLQLAEDCVIFPAKVLKCHITEKESLLLLRCNNVTWLYIYTNICVRIHIFKYIEPLFSSIKLKTLSIPESHS